MTWKDFLKPGIGKVILFLILLAISRPFELFWFGCLKRIVCVTTPCPYYCVEYSFEGLAITFIFWYLVSCLIIWILPKKFKKNLKIKQEKATEKIKSIIPKKPLSITVVSIFLFLLGIILLLDSISFIIRFGNEGYILSLFSLLLLLFSIGLWKMKKWSLPLGLIVSIIFIIFGLGIINVEIEGLLWLIIGVLILLTFYRNRNLYKKVKK